MDRRTAEGHTRKLVATYAPGTQVDGYTVAYAGVQFPLSFGENVLVFGPEEAARRAQRGAGAWGVASVNPALGPRVVQAVFDARGRLAELQFRTRAADAGEQPATVAEMRPQAARLAEELFEVKVGDTQPVELVYDPASRVWQDKRPVDRRWEMWMGPGTPVEWILPGEAPGTQRGIKLYVDRQGLARAVQDAELTTPRNQAWRGLKESRYLMWDRTAAFGWGMPMVLLALSCVVLFALLGLYRRTVWPALMLSVVACGAATVLWYAHAVGTRQLGGAEAFLVPIVFIALLVVAYAIVSVPLRYLRSLPERAGSLWDLARRGIFARSAGLGLLRGASLGAGYLAVHALLLFAGVTLRLFAPSLALIDLGTMEAAIPPAWEGPSVPVAAIALLASLGSVLLFTALPFSLLKRARVRPAVVIGGTVFLWTISTSLLAGASAYPLWAVYAFAALQGVFFSSMLLKYDLLTCLAAALTIETWLFAYPMYLVVGQTQPWWDAWGIIQWYVVLTFALVAATLPQIVAGWKRLTTVFAG